MVALIGSWSKPSRVGLRRGGVDHASLERAHHPRSRAPDQKNRSILTQIDQDRITMMMANWSRFRPKPSIQHASFDSTCSYGPLVFESNRTDHHRSIRT